MAGWLVPALAVLGLATAPFAPPPMPTGGPSGAILIAICGDAGHVIALPMGGGGKDRRDCPTGCHAMCPRRSATGEGGAGDEGDFA